MINALFAFALIATNAFADANQAAPDIFKKPARAGGTQWLLGIAEWIAANRIRPGALPEQIDVTVAESALKQAQDLPVSEEQRQATIKAIKDNPNNYVLDDVELKASAADRIERLQSAQLVDAELKQSVIEGASLQLTETRAAAIEIAAARGLLPQGLRVLRVAGSALLLVDIAARIYVWNALDADPTLSPTYTYFEHTLGN